MSRGISNAKTAGIASGLTGRHHAGGAAGDVWFADTSGFNLTQALDFRQLDGGSVLSLDGNNGCFGATDLSGNGNDALHWRPSGNSELARVHADGDALDIHGVTLERHWGQKMDGTDNPSMGNGFHTFIVIELDNDGLTGTGSGGVWDLPTSASTTSVQCRFTRHGGAVTTPAQPEVEHGTAGNLNGFQRTHLAGLCGTIADGTQPTKFPVLVEFRVNVLDFETQLWVNGLNVLDGNNGGLCAQMTYCLIGKQDLNNQNSAFRAGTKLHAFAWGKTDSGTPFTKALAAEVRAAMLADFGIPVWTGGTDYIRTV
jgi:hypothetical protein